MTEDNTPVDITVLMNHPPDAASKRTLSNASEKRYRESVNSMLDEISINESTERLFMESKETPDFGGRLKEAAPIKTGLPNYYHKRTRSA